MTTGLVVDLGAATVAAMAVTESGAWLVADPTSGASRWSAAMHWDGRQVIVGALADRRRRTDPDGYATGFTRDLDRDEPALLGARRFGALEQVAGLLAVIRAESHRQYGPADRAVITIPTDYRPGDPRRARMVAAAEAAGFGAVELLSDAVAAICTPLPGPPFAAEDLVLVYHLDVDFEATVLRVGVDLPQVLGHARVGDLARQPVGLLEQTLTCCHDLLATLGTAKTAGAGGPGPFALAAIMPVGAGCRSPGLEVGVSQGLGVPVRQVEAPELAVVRGAAAWLARTSPRQVIAVTSPDRMVPLAFTIPGGSARLLRWLVVPAQPYDEGCPLARVRLADGAVWDLTARSRGTVAEILVPDGAPVSTGEWLATTRP